MYKTLLILFISVTANATLPETINDPGTKEAADYLDQKISYVNNRIDSATGALIGPQGPAGSQGPAGPTGVQGPQGIVGPQGPGTFTYNTTNYYSASGGLFEIINGNMTPIIYTTAYDSAWEYNTGGDIEPRL